MATTEHCLACFEALEAHLEKRKPLSLDEIQASLVSPASTSSSGPKDLRDPALRRIAAAADSSSSSSSSSSTSLAASTPATSTSSLPLPSSHQPPTSAPLFVTWNTVDDPSSSSSSSDPDADVSLRGCIGTFESQPLADGIPEYALISALYDSRFSPIRAPELPTLRVAVTLLTDFEDAQDPRDWDVGVHGIRLSFHDRGRRYGATYLPDVAAEQGWSKDETLFSLVRKAGWTGSRSRWGDLELKVTRYRGKKSTLGYADYKKWREGLEN